MKEPEPIDAKKVFLCIADLLIGFFATAYLLDNYSTRQGFLVCHALLPWMAMIGYFPTALYLGNRMLTRVVRALILLWLVFLAWSLPGSVEILSQELGTPDAVPAMRKALLPLPYVSLLLAAACLIRFSPKRLAGGEG